MDFPTFEAEFWAQLATLQFEAGTLHEGPALRPPPPGVGLWRLNWYVFFPDNLYIRVADQWAPRRKPNPGSTRNYFSFHYGDRPPVNDSRGLPRYHSSDPTVIRIDMKDPHDVHMHYAGKDHIGETSVSGRSIRHLRAVDFVRAVLEHRATGKTFEELLGFRL